MITTKPQLISPPKVKRTVAPTHLRDEEIRPREALKVLFELRY